MEKNGYFSLLRTALLGLGSPPRNTRRASPLWAPCHAAGACMLAILSAAARHLTHRPWAGLLAQQVWPSSQLLPSSDSRVTSVRPSQCHVAPADGTLLAHALEMRPEVQAALPRGQLPPWEQRGCRASCPGQCAEQKQDGPLNRAHSPSDAARPHSPLTRGSRGACWSCRPSCEGVSDNQPHD